MRDFNNEIFLSAREKQILNHAMLGHTDAWICEALGLGAGTVKSYWIRIRQKCNAHNRCQAIANYLDAQSEAAQERATPPEEDNSA